MDNYLRVGKIINTRGLKGEVKILPLTDNLNRFDDLNLVYLEDEKNRELLIEEVNYHNKNVYIKFIGINNIDDAEKLKEKYIQIHRDNALKLNEDQYFICDILGLKVYENNDFLGYIEDVIQTGANDVYIVKDNENEILIPAIKDVVLDINIKKGFVKVKLLEGLR